MAGIEKQMLNIAEVKRHLYPEEFESYLELKKLFGNKRFGKRHITLFYPGCSSDVINPLLYLDALLDWQKVKAINLIYVDMNGIAPGFIKAMLNKITSSNVRLKYLSDITAEIRFTLNNTRIILIYMLANVLETMPRVLENGFDIYFERAFEIFRANEAGFIQFVLEHVNKDGLLISDCGFCRQDLLKRHGFVDFGPRKLPSELGLYNNLKIYKKRKN